MLIWFGNLEAKPDQNNFNNATVFSSEVGILRMCKDYL